MYCDISNDDVKKRRVKIDSRISVPSLSHTLSLLPIGRPGRNGDGTEMCESTFI